MPPQKKSKDITKKRKTIAAREEHKVGDLAGRKVRSKPVNKKKQKTLPNNSMDI